MVRAGNGVIGIVREVYSKWERRCPFTPDHVRRLRELGVRVLVQPCTKRIFTDNQFEAAGAELVDDLSPANTIFGVKQVPQDQLLPDRTYMFFSHVIKAQLENMPLLDEILAQRVRLIDYERINQGGDSSAPRCVAFGQYAGKAGMVNTFRGLGERLLSRGFSSPFLSIGSAYQHQDYDQAMAAIRRLGEKISADGTPAHFAPLIFVFTGNGNVSQGAQIVARELGDAFEMVELESLPELVAKGKSGEVDRRKIYGTVCDIDNMAVRNDGGPFDATEYLTHPERYSPIFHERVAPYASVIVNSCYWDARYPRLLTTEQQRELIADKRTRLLAVGDITCDVGGSIEFLATDTSIEKPYFHFDFDPSLSADTDSPNSAVKESVPQEDDTSVLMMGVDILPSEFPIEASAHFGDALLPYVPILAGDGDGAGTGAGMTDEEVQLREAELAGACITQDGKLQPHFEYILGMREAKERDLRTMEEQERDILFSAVEGTELSPRLRQQLEGSTVLNVQGHLFDSGLINQVLNLIEEHKGRFAVIECNVAPNTGPQKYTSSALLQITMDEGRHALEEVITAIETLASVIPQAEAEVAELPKYCEGQFGRTLMRE